MPDEEKLRLGEILIKEGILTEEQLAEVIKFQKGKDSYTPLGEICVASGYLSRHELKALLKKYRKNMRIGETFLALGIINENQLKEVLAHQKEKKIRLGELMVKRGMITEEHLIEALSNHLDIPRIIPDPSLIDRSLLTGLNKKFLMANHMIPIYKDDNNEVTVIFADPLAGDIIKNLEAHFKCKVLPAIALKEDIEYAFKPLFMEVELGKIDLSEKLFSEQAKELALIIKDMNLYSDADRTVQVINYIITEAVKHGASDIHIEPQSSKVRVRFRIDGILHNKTDLPVGLGPYISSRIKALCGLDIAEHRRHQDGRVEAKVLGKPVDLRISTYASLFGENVVIRILQRQTHLMDLEKLGFSPLNMTKYEKILNYPTGIILVTGPTGSGKTTTLYASLNYLNSKEKMIITVEDPVEYTIDGVVQGKTDLKLGLTYSDFLKSIMRQDPDVIMVGEIRDADAAAATIQAALTGHKIFSSFHTDDSTGALLRLMDMGIDTFLISSTIVSVVAQRLVRVICNECKKEYVPERNLLTTFQIDPDEAANFKFYKGKGCKACNNTGYSGRTAIHELLLVNDAVRNAILAKKTSSEIRLIANKESELVSMRDDGIYKSVKGITNFEEILRVVFTNESDQYRGRSIAEICDICKMVKGIEKSDQVKIVTEISFKEEKVEPPKQISIPTPFTEPIDVKILETDPSTLPVVEILRVRLKASEAQNEIDKIASIFNEYVSASKIFGNTTEEMVIEDFIEYIIFTIARSRIRLNVEFVEIVVRTRKDGIKLYLETISQKPAKNALMMQSMPVNYERLVEELDFKKYLRSKK